MSYIHYSYIHYDGCMRICRVCDRHHRGGGVLLLGPRSGAGAMSTTSGSTTLGSVAPMVHARRRAALRAARRRAALRALLHFHDLDALLVTDLLNVRYLTGFTGSSAALLVDAGGEERTVFCTDGRYDTQSRRQVPDLRRVIERAGDLRLAKEAADRGVERLGFESHVVTVDSHAALAEVTGADRLRRAARLVEQLRLVKDAAEVAALRAACAAADTALEGLLAAGGLRPGPVSYTHLTLPTKRIV